jgi:hypothetical protein
VHQDLPAGDHAAHGAPPLGRPSFIAGCAPTETYASTPRPALLDPPAARTPTAATGQIDQSLTGASGEPVLFAQPAARSSASTAIDVATEPYAPCRGAGLAIAAPRDRAAMPSEPFGDEDLAHVLTRVAVVQLPLERDGR